MSSTSRTRTPAASRTRTTVVSLMAVGALLGAAGAASADGGGSQPSGAPTGDGAKAICKRAPKIGKRIDRILERLNGDASQRGSVARLEQRVANAKSAGHTQIETYLNDRLTFRRSLVPTLEGRQKDLADVNKWCASHDNGANS
ncbi:hypothetical protein ACFYW8_01305 [Streptomyces sp. NPDC002742]|uniref:hypothetical protein n=1 Tax=Streptomyces sp. NPDC002742 TaxID=3364663 RepID=UPI00367E2BE2